MSLPGIRDRDDIRPGQRGQVSDFTHVVRTHFEHGEAMAFSMRVSINGMPMSLFRLPIVAIVEAAPARQAAVISLSVVLPLLPVMPITVAAS